MRFETFSEKVLAILSSLADNHEGYVPSAQSIDDYCVCFIKKIVGQLG